MNGRLFRHSLPAADGGIHMAGIELDRIAAPSCSFGGEVGRRRCGKKGSRTISPRCLTSRICVADHGKGFDGRMKVNTGVSPAAREGIHARIVPDARPVAPVPAELHVIGARSVASAEHEHELAPRAIKRSHAPVGLHPYAEVQQLAVDRRTAPTISTRCRQSMQAKKVPPPPNGRPLS